MAITIRRRPRRKPGERANLSMAKITAAAFDVLEMASLHEFSARTRHYNALADPEPNKA